MGCYKMLPFSQINEMDIETLIGEIYLKSGVILSNEEKIEKMSEENDEIKLNLEFVVMTDSSLTNDKQRKHELTRLLKENDKYNNNDKKISDFKKKNEEMKIEISAMKRVFMYRCTNINL